MRGILKAGAVVLALAIGLAWGSQAYADPWHGHGGWGHGYYRPYGHSGYYRPGIYFQFGLPLYRGYYGGYGGGFYGGHYPRPYYPGYYSYPGYYYGGYGGCY